MNLSAKHKRDGVMNKKLRKDERGVAHLLLIVLAVVVIGGAAAVGWKVMNNNKTTTAKNSSSASTTTSTASNAEDSSCLATYHDTNLCHFSEFASSFNNTAYTATITNKQNGVVGTLTLESDGKGNTEFNGTSAGQTIAAVTLDGVTYIQTASGGPWIEYPTGTTSPVTSPTSSMDLGLGSGVTFKDLGTTVCGSLTCYKYELLDSATPSATQYVLFDTSQYKLREWQYSDTSGDSTDMTVSYGSVNITKPSPVESLSSLE